MITLFQTPPAWGLSSFSPFCLKIETYLRMSELPYEAKEGDIRKAPKGKVPWIEDGGKLISDSTDIIDYLKKSYGDPLDGELDAEQRAIALAIQRMVEEHMYFAIAALRWRSDAAWPHLKKAFAPVLPKLLAPVISKVIRKSVDKAVNAQGMGRHDHDDIVKRFQRDLDALSVLLGDKPFMLGDEPTSVDAMMYGFGAQVYYTPWDSDEKRAFGACENIAAHCERMKQRYWSGDEAS